MGAVAPIVMSILVFSGSAQFGALAVLAAGGSTGAAIVAAVLLNARYLAMGVALAPSLRGRASSRAAFALTTVDASWAAASIGGGAFDPWYMVGVSIPQYAGWVLGTVVGSSSARDSAIRTRSGSTRCSRPSSSRSCLRKPAAGAGSPRPAAVPGSRSP